MPRSSIAVEEALADALSDEARKHNKTLYAFANESLEAVISVSRLSGNPSELVSAWKMSRMLKEVDAVPLPGDLVEKLIKKLYESEKDWLLKTWLNEGDRIGKYLQMGYQELTQLSQAAAEFQGLLPLKRIEIRSINSGDSKGRNLLRAIGAGQSIESTACAEQFIRGIVASYSWSVKGSKVSEGIIELEIAKDRQ